jgi:hypothetical protein
MIHGPTHSQIPAVPVIQMVVQACMQIVNFKEQ